MNPPEGAQERREMTELRPVAPNERWRRLWAASGWTLIALGGAAIIGWILTIRVLVQPIESRAPLRPAAALGLFALGVAALACDRGLRRTALALATIGAAIGLTGLLELGTGSSLGLDGLPLRPDLEALIGMPGSAQVPFSTAWGLILGGAGIVAVVTGLKRPPRSEEHTSELQSPCNLVCRLLLEK